ncbi:MAG: D-alanyl-D-alanine carboxypeptidase/D-alanyl-D-alanine-endopeptidase [Chitinophagaceae bacterium]|nr:D-alanyl-D-alanine carboxypeptidase/D-alanyl-D-alanine-endopeptidase [Chitinophagaceae bacterium]
MMKIWTAVVLCFIFSVGIAQTPSVKILQAVKKLEADPQMKHAMLSLYIVDSKTGKLVFDKNAQVGLAPASSLKVVTSAAAMELLGKDYRYQTEFGYDGNIEGNILKGNLFVKVSGDPTLGSWRWDSSKAENMLDKLSAILIANNITSITGDLVIDDSKWETQATPRGWTWEDIGNYYGAGARGLNWHENQYDLMLAPGKNEGDSVKILWTDPELQASVLVNELKTGKPGSGDNTVIYLPEDGVIGYVRGTVPAAVSTFRISGSLPNASNTFTNAVAKSFQNSNIHLAGRAKNAVVYFAKNEKLPVAANYFFSVHSPPLDSINYWFLQKSVNLFGEAFVKTIAFEKTGYGSADSGISIIKEFWKERGIANPALKMIDGSGLSPANRVTTHALVTVMQYAKKQNWFASFYNALPLQNGIKMKSGYIGGVRSYTGYIKSGSGTEYTFSFIINNFDGSPGAVREKMWKLLDILK